MFSKLKQWNLLAQYEKEEDRRMARVQLNIIAFNCFLSLIVLFVNLIIWRGKSLTIILILGYVLHLILFVLVIKKHLSASSLLLTSAYVLMVSTIATIGGGLHDYVVMIYPVIIMYAGLTAQKRGLIFATLLSFAGLSWLVFGEIFGWFVITVSHVADQTDLLVSLILITLAAWMVHILISNMGYGLTQTWRELAERKRIEMELRKLSQAVEQSPTSIVIADLDGNIEYVNPRFTQITGYGFEESIGKNPRVLKTPMTPPETHRQLWENLLVGQEWRGEFVNRKKDGSIYYESALISPIFDEDGKPSHYLAVKEDITQRRKIASDLRASEARFRALFNQNHDGVFIIGLDGKTKDANQRAAEMLGYSIEELQEGKDRESLAASEALSENSFVRVLAGEHIPIFERMFRKKDGSAFPVEINLELVHDEDGTLLHVQSIVRDITQRKQAENALQKNNEQLRADMEKVEQLKEELREQAIRDPLTGLFNRRYLNETLEREIVRAGRENVPLSVIMADVDHFKMINDTYGHPVGDKFLVEIASLLKSHARGSDIVSRYGGEEFLLVLPGTALDSAARRAEEIRRKCAEIIIQHEGKDLKVTMSFGVATYPAHGKDAEEIIIKADKALYRAKAQGRNCTVIFE